MFFNKSMQSLFLFISGEYFVHCEEAMSYHMCNMFVCKMIVNRYMNCFVPPSVQNETIIPYPTSE